jgi:hypothetical protein
MPNAVLHFQERSNELAARRHRPLTKSAGTFASRAVLLTTGTERGQPHFVKTLLARKQAPKGWQYFTHHSETASGYEGKVAAEMIGAKFEEFNAWAWNLVREHVAKTTARPAAPF